MKGLFGMATPPYEMQIVYITLLTGVYRQVYVPSLLSVIFTSTGLESTSTAVMSSGAVCPALRASTVNSATVLTTTPCG